MPSKLRIAPDVPRIIGSFNDIRAFTLKTGKDGKDYGVSVARTFNYMHGADYRIVISDRATRAIVATSEPIPGVKTTGSYRMPDETRATFDRVRKMSGDAFSRWVARLGQAVTA
jgi:hypothetical protein